MSKKKEEFVPIEDIRIRFYHCGPTVYWVQHIGNLRGMTMADLIRRSLEVLDYDVAFARNYTDVGHLTGDNEGDADQGEDRMEKAAKREGVDPQMIAKKYIEIFEEDIKALNISPANYKPVASEYVESMIEMVKKILDNGYAYTTPQAIYFEVDKFQDYNKLNRQNLEENLQGEGKGVVSDPDKKKPYDFALWFFKTGQHKNALQYWESPFESPDVTNGEGIPGWHIECSAMAQDIFGPTLDLHMGGIEHISIHHTNEIAQSEAATGKKYVNYWLHNEHLTVDGRKMSKSSGTSYILKDIKEKGYDPMVLRYFFLNSHYRSKQNFTWEALSASESAFDKMKLEVRELLEEVKEVENDTGYEENEFYIDFLKALEDDFNVPQALAAFWNLLKSETSSASKLAIIFKMDQVFGLRLDEIKPLLIPGKLQMLLDERKIAREEKDWEKSDALRNEIIEQYGVKVLDTEEGQKVV